MDDELISVQQGNSGSRKRVKNDSKRQKLKTNRYSHQDLKQFKYPCKHNGKGFECLEVKLIDIRSLRTRFYEETDKIVQDVKLCHMLSVAPVKRHRPKKDVKQRTSTVSYFVKTIENKTFKVCQKFFLEALGITKHRIITVANALAEGKVPTEKRGGDRVSKKSAPKKEKVREFINKLRGKESHYNRSKSRRIYLSAYLSIAKLQKIFNRQCQPEHRVTYDMFRKIFIHEFNIGFSSPAADVCSYCTRLKQQIKLERDVQKRNQLVLEYRIHKKRANTFYELVREEHENTITFCFDLQQVQPLPKTPIGEAFYSHQISFYAFCCVGVTSRNPTFYVWTEDQAKRGSTEVGSALLNYLDSLDYSEINCLRLFCDGCGGQNKNSHIIHTLLYWLKNKSPESVRKITVTYPVRGHSFLAADRAFGRTEKILRTHSEIISKEEYVDLYSEVGSVKSLGTDWQIYNIKDLEKIYKKVKGIAECKRIFLQKVRIANSEPMVKVATSEFFRFTTQKDRLEVLTKKGKSDDKVELQRWPLRNEIPEKKKKTLRNLMKEHFGEKWEMREDLDWYKKLLTTTETAEEEGNTEENEEVGDQEACDCLEEDYNLHV